MLICIIWLGYNFVEVMPFIFNKSKWVKKMEHYKIEVAGEIETQLNDNYKKGWEFVCFLPMLTYGMLRNQRILFKRLK